MDNGLESRIKPLTEKIYNSVYSHAGPEGH